MLFVRDVSPELCVECPECFVRMIATVPLVKLRGGFLFVLEKKGGKDWPVVDVTYSFEILMT